MQAGDDVYIERDNIITMKFRRGKFIQLNIIWCLECLSNITTSGLFICALKILSEKCSKKYNIIEMLMHKGGSEFKEVDFVERMSLGPKGCVFYQ